MKRKFKQQISISTKSTCISYMYMNSDVCIRLINVISMHLLGFLFSFPIISLVQCFHYSDTMEYTSTVVVINYVGDNFCTKVTRSLVVYVCFVDRCLSFCTFFFWPLCCLFVFEIQILITPFGIFKLLLTWWQPLYLPDLLLVKQLSS